MSVLVVGSIALDTVETVHGKVKDSLGGSAIYFSAAASFFNPINMVGVVGTDFDFSQIEFLKDRNVDFSGIVVEKGETFRWGGRYKKNMNQRITLFTYLNVFKDFKPKIPAHYRENRYIFLANIDPDLQLEILTQIDRPRLSVLDTMDFWINSKRKSLMRLIPKIDVLILNDEELRELTHLPNMFEGAHFLLEHGPKAIVIKKGEHGAILVDQEGYFIAPAYPLPKPVDPTGAGDSFAGGFLGYLSSCDKIDNWNLRRAVIHGTVTASFAVEDFSVNRLKKIDMVDINARVDKLRAMTTF